MIEKEHEINRAVAEMRCCAEKLQVGIRDAQVNLQKVEFRMANQADEALKAVNRMIDIIREQV